MNFMDRQLTCADCRQEFIFTAGEQLFFFDKQFKNDPKRCKPCKSKRGTGLPAIPGGSIAVGLSRTETRTLCSDCGIETTVPFKPTQGRPVLCRGCFQAKRAPVPAIAALPPVSGISPQVTVESIPALSMEQATAELVAAASNTAALEHAPGMAVAIAAAIEVPQA